MLKLEHVDVSESCRQQSTSHCCPSASPAVLPTEQASSLPLGFTQWERARDCLTNIWGLRFQTQAGTKKGQTWLWEHPSSPLCPSPESRPWRHCCASSVFCSLGSLGAMVMEFRLTNHSFLPETQSISCKAPAGDKGEMRDGGGKSNKPGRCRDRESAVPELSHPKPGGSCPEQQADGREVAGSICFAHSSPASSTDSS